MSPTLEAGDWIVSIQSRLAPPRPGLIAVLRRPDRPETVLIKRLLHLEADGWFVVGDQPSRSTDSRSFGPVPEHLIEGVAAFRYGPPPRLRWLLR